MRWLLGAATAALATVAAVTAWHELAPWFRYKVDEAALRALASSCALRPLELSERPGRPPRMPSGAASAAASAAACAEYDRRMRAIGY